ncbi:MAG: TonB-dependent receptor [Acidobacteria bacterium]|nr:TonB-dependent receptor [Acidobacteriota bacterium]
MKPLHFLWCLTALSMAPLYAQSDTAVFFGVVKDPAGAVLPKVKVRLKNTATSQSRELSTDDKGLYYFTLLPPGAYEVSAEAQGFKHFVDSQVRLQVAQVSRLDIQMQLGSVTESITVNESTSVLNTETVSHGTVISQEKLPALPLNGRQFLQLVLLVPGVNPGGRAVQQNAVRQNQIGGLSIAGGRTNNTQFLLDGAVNIDPDYSSLNYSPAVDSIAEFQVQTAMVPAEFGRAAVNVVTRGGGNDRHGAAWEFLRNRAVDARPFNLPSSLPQYQRNQFGGNLGGPILKNRLFYFGSYEGLRVRQAGGGLTSVLVPSSLKRQADFSEVRAGVFDPDTLANGVRTPFPNNKIPTSRLNAQSMAGMLALPQPSDPTTSLFVNAAGLLSQNNNNYSGRADFSATSKWSLFGRYSISEEKADQPATVPGRDGVNNARSQNATIGSTYILKPNLLNETRLGMSRLHILTGLIDPLFTVNGQPQYLPQFNVSGYPLFGGAGQFTATTGGGLLNVRNTTFQIYDNLAWTHGRHIVKAGAELMQVRYGRIETPSSLGNFQFTNGFTTRTARNDGTGDALASFLLGYAAVGNRSVGPNRADGRQNIFGVYVQDDFRLRSNLTLNVGLRYELAPPMYEVNGAFAGLDFGSAATPGAIFASGQTGVSNIGMFVCGQVGTPRSCAYTDRNNFAPRVGVVWNAFDKTVIRAGAGVFYANTDANPLFRLAAGLPYNVSQTLNSDNFVPRFKDLNIFGRPVVGPSQLQAASLDMGQRTSYSLQWNASLQRQLARDIVLEVGYLATAGVKLEQNVQPNNALPGTGAVDPRRPYRGMYFVPGTTFPNYLDVAGNSVPLGLVNFLPHSAQSNYHSGYLRLEKRFRSGFSLLSAYTWAKAITNAPQFRNAGGVNGSENSPAQNSFNLSAERGLASFNVGHRSVTSFVYDMPFGSHGKYLRTGIANWILNDIQLSGIYSAQTGFPFTANLRGDTAGVGAGTGGIFVRPNAVQGTSADLAGSARNTSRWFNTSAFALPAAATFGNVGRNTIVGPGLSNLDFVIMKNIPAKEKFHLQLRLEAFNLTNTPNYSVIGRIINDPTFGRVQSQLDPRQLQIGLKALF